MRFCVLRRLRIVCRVFKSIGTERASAHVSAYRHVVRLARTTTSCGVGGALGYSPHTWHAGFPRIFSLLLDSIVGSERGRATWTGRRVARVLREEALRAYRVKSAIGRIFFRRPTPRRLRAVDVYYETNSKYSRTRHKFYNSYCALVSAGTVSFSAL